MGTPLRKDGDILMPGPWEGPPAFQQSMLARAAKNTLVSPPSASHGTGLVCVLGEGADTTVEAKFCALGQSQVSHI